MTPTPSNNLSLELLTGRGPSPVSSPAFSREERGGTDQPSKTTKKEVVGISLTRFTKF
jgi:hypothetical protein